MSHFTFERECRTPHSEAYTILESANPVGRLDLHFTPTVIHCTLCVSESLTQEIIQELIETIDEELVDAVGLEREEFIVHIYQGREAGVFSDHEYGEDNEHDEG